MSVESHVTAVVINFNTRDLTLRAVHSFGNWYPALPLLLIDNGSDFKCVDALKQFHHQQQKRFELILNNKNVHHGPAMDQALRHLQSPYVFFLDSDCEIQSGGFLEQMLSIADHDQQCYAVGHKIYMNKRGYDSTPKAGAFAYIRPYCMLIKRSLYFKLPAFEYHGAPCLCNMMAATEYGFGLVDFPVLQFVRHDGRGTAGRYGYHLGLRGRLNHLLNKLGL